MNSPVNATAAIPPERGKFSLSRLSAAFSKMTGTSNSTVDSDGRQQVAKQSKPIPSNLPDKGVVTPRMIVEGMLFIGIDKLKQADSGPEDQPLTSREMASHIRDVTPEEVDQLVEELNSVYCDEGSAYEIVIESGGYHLRLREEYNRVRERFHGRIRDAKLTLAAMEVLAVVAYKQPITAEQIQKLRGSRCHAVLCQLVRRELLTIERPAHSPRKPWYRTTDRFNRLFHLQSLDDLPRREDLDDS